MDGFWVGETLVGQEIGYTFFLFCFLNFGGKETAILKEENRCRGMQNF